MIGRRWIGGLGVGGTLLLMLAGGALGVPDQLGDRLLFTTAGDGVSGRLEIASVGPDGRGFARLTRHEPSGFSPRWTSDGRRILFTTYDSITERGAHWRMRADGSRFERLPSDEYGAPSPSGRLIAEFGRRGINLVNGRGHKVRTLHLPLGEADSYDGVIVWSRDERLIAVSVASETDNGDYVRAFVLHVDGRTRARAVSPRIDGSNEYAMSWSPTGRWLAVDVSGAIEYTSIALVRADGRSRRVLVADAAASWAHAWSPNGRQLAYVGRKGGIFAIGTATRRVRRLARTRSLGREVNSIDVRWSPTGREVAFSDAGGVYRVRANGSKLRRVTTSGRWSNLAWSPDGRRLAFSQGYDVFVVRADGRGLHRITQALQDDSPVASPDGRRIAFIRGTRGLENADRIHIYVMGADGGGLRRVARGYQPRWAPDGRRLAFVDVPPDQPPQLGLLRTGRIMVADVDAGTVEHVAMGTAPTWAPDGMQLAYVRYTVDVRDTWRGVWARVTGSALWVLRLDGSDPRKVLDSEDVEQDEEEGPGFFYRPTWSPDRRWIAVVGPSTMLVDPVTATKRNLPEIGSRIAWSPDASRLAGAGSYPNALRVVDVATAAVTVADPEREEFEHHFPAWSPDGTSLGFVGCDVRADSPDCDVYAVGADGRGRRRLTRTPGIEESLVWAR